MTPESTNIHPGITFWFNEVAKKGFQTPCIRISSKGSKKCGSEKNVFNGLSGWLKVDTYHNRCFFTQFFKNEILRTSVDGSRKEFAGKLYTFEPHKLENGKWLLVLVDVLDTSIRRIRIDREGYKEEKINQQLICERVVKYLNSKVRADCTIFPHISKGPKAILEIRQVSYRTTLANVDCSSKEKLTYLRSAAELVVAMHKDKEIYNGLTFANIFINADHQVVLADFEQSQSFYKKTFIPTTGLFQTALVDLLALTSCLKVILEKSEASHEVDKIFNPWNESLAKALSDMETRLKAVKKEISLRSHLLSEHCPDQDYKDFINMTLKNLPTVEAFLGVVDQLLPLIPPDKQEPFSLKTIKNIVAKEASKENRATDIFLSKMRTESYRKSRPNKTYVPFDTKRGGFLNIQWFQSIVNLIIFDKKLDNQNDRKSKIRSAIKLQIPFTLNRGGLVFGTPKKRRVVVVFKSLFCRSTQSITDFQACVGAVQQREHEDIRNYSVCNSFTRQGIAEAPELLPIRWKLDRVSGKPPHANILTVQRRYESDLFNSGIHLADKITFFLHAVSTVISLHRNSLVHGTFNLANILVRRHKNKLQGTKLIDFSALGSIYSKPSTHRHYPFIERFAAQYGLHSQRLDVWSATVSIGKLMYPNLFENPDQTPDELKRNLIRALTIEIRTSKSRHFNVPVATLYHDWLMRLYKEEEGLEAYLNREITLFVDDSESKMTRINFLKSALCSDSEREAIMNEITSLHASLADLYVVVIELEKLHKEAQV